MSSLPPKRRKSFMNRYATKSVAYELIIWLFFWGLYAVWAGYSPSYPKSTHSQPLFPIVILGFMAAFFFIFGDRHELKLLIANSLIALILVPGLLALNIYRAIAKKFPQSWDSAGFFVSEYTFFFIQCVFLFLSILLLRYTRDYWKANPFTIPKRYYFYFAVIIAIFLFLLFLVLIFLFAGKV